MNRTSETQAPPAQDPICAERTEVGLDDSGRADSGPSLLLLEDDEALRQMLDWELAELGYQVLSVNSCHAARNAAAAHDFDLALFDIGLPDGDGAELAGELVDNEPAPRIVLCSGRSENQISESLAAKVLAFIVKPVSIQRLDLLFRSAA